MKTKSMTGKRSNVWNYFKKLGNNQSSCNLCGKFYKTSGNTTNLRMHLKNKHSSAFKAISTCQSMSPSYPTANGTSKSAKEDAELDISNVYNPHAETEQRQSPRGTPGTRKTSRTRLPSNSVSSSSSLKLNQEGLFCSQTSEDVELDISNVCHPLSETSTSVSSPPSKEGSRKKSDVWSYFQKLFDNECFCNLCGKIYKTSGNTTNLRTHLKFKHSSAFEDISAPDFIPHDNSKITIPAESTSENEENKMDINYEPDPHMKSESRLSEKEPSALENTETSMSGSLVSTSKESLKRRKSDVWSYFRKLLDNECLCNLCGKTYKTGGNTTNMRLHLKCKHSSTFKAMSSAASVPPSNPKVTESAESTSQREEEDADTSDEQDSDLEIEWRLSSLQPEVSMKILETSISSNVVSNSTPTERTRKKRSDVWSYFRKLDDNNCLCSLCEKKYKTCGNTTNLRMHLRHKHIDTFEAMLNAASISPSNPKTTVSAEITPEIKTEASWILETSGISTSSSTVLPSSSGIDSKLCSSSKKFADKVICARETDATQPNHQTTHKDSLSLECTEKRGLKRFFDMAIYSSMPPHGHLKVSASVCPPQVKNIPESKFAVVDENQEEIILNIEEEDIMDGERNKMDAKLEENGSKTNARVVFSMDKNESSSYTFPVYIDSNSSESNDDQIIKHSEDPHQKGDRENPIKVEEGEKAHSPASVRNGYAGEEVITGTNVCIEKRFSCNSCEKTFSLKTYLESHLKEHMDIEPCYLCSTCGKTFSLKGNFLSHMRRHNSDRMFDCEKCGKHFHQKANLDAHIKIHTGERPFLCSSCGMRFRLKYDLISHSRIHDGIKPFSCEICGMNFARKNNLVSHQFRHQSEKPYACQICHKDFKVKWDLKKHLVTHSDVKPYMCKICPRRFARKDNLNSHMAMHSHNPIYQCDYCNRVFTHRSNYTKHLRTHTSDTDEIIKKLQVV